MTNYISCIYSEGEVAEGNFGPPFSPVFLAEIGSEFSQKIPESHPFLKSNFSAMEDRYFQLYYYLKHSVPVDSNDIFVFFNPNFPLKNLQDMNFALDKLTISAIGDVKMSDYRFLPSMENYLQVHSKFNWPDFETFEKNNYQVLSSDFIVGTKETLLGLLEWILGVRIRIPSRDNLSIPVLNFASYHIFGKNGKLEVVNPDNKQ